MIRACPRDYAAARIGVASAWIGNAGRIAATADRLDNAAEFCCSRPSFGARFLGQRASLNNGNGAGTWAPGAVH